jgi:hypothetical protein
MVLNEGSRIMVALNWTSRVYVNICSSHFVDQGGTHVADLPCAVSQAA